MRHLDLPLNKVIWGDCLQVMKTLPDKSVDLVLTDPPYGIGRDGQKGSISKTNTCQNRKAYDFRGWDRAIPSKAYFDEIFRVSKNQIIWGGNYFVTHLDESHKGWLVWDKGQKGLTMSDGELAYTSFDTPLRIFTLSRVAIRTDGAVHPTQKPVKLMRWCLELFSKPAHTILDPFLGSGTTAVACKQLGRNFIGIELDPRYVDIANKRIHSLPAALPFPVL